jgi:hypothetical protein
MLRYLQISDTINLDVIDQLCEESVGDTFVQLQEFDR